MRWKQLTYYIMCAVGLTTCMIEDDSPYPMVVSEITEIAVEGQCAAPDAQSAEATIDKKNRTVNITVNDSVDLRKLKITKLVVSEEATIKADSASCVDYANFPTKSFASLAEVSSTAMTRMNFTKPVTFTLGTYQKYVWTVNVAQYINR